MAILRIKDKNGVWQEIPAIVGRKGDNITVKSFVPSAVDGGTNIIVLSDGTEIHILNGQKGSQGNPATINGVNALKIEGRDGIGVVQNGDTITLHSTGEGSEGVAAVLINRSTKVTESDTNYTTLMARGTSLNSAETTPTVNGAIYWTYE